MTALPAPTREDDVSAFSLPVIASPGFTIRPLFIVFAYVVGTFLLFLLWPIHWPIYGTERWLLLIAYVTLCLAAIAAGMGLGGRGETGVVAPLRHLPVILAVGAGLAALLLIPSCYAYTDRGPWRVLEALRDPGDAYKRLQVQLYATTGQRTLIVALRSLAAPLTYAVVPLGILNWRRIGWPGRVSVLIVVLSSLVFSIMRGTDKEIADLLIAAFAATLVSIGRSVAAGTGRRRLVLRYFRPVLIGLFCIYFAQGLSTDRKDARLGGYAARTAVCANDSRICADLDSAQIAWLPLRQRFGLTLFILSTCSGYYGLELALEKPFVPAWGVGHSPAALGLYEAVTGDPSLHFRTFTWRGGDDHWSEDYYWSTLITWIANDTGFAGAPFVLALIGYLWAQWWREAAAGMSDSAAILFVLATTMIFYLPANNQVFASYEGYSIFAVWLAVWLWQRSRQRLSVRLPTGLFAPA
jgi:hypothetical protein